MKDLPFERIAQIVAIAAVGGNERSIVDYNVERGEVGIRFSEYVKSQVHLNVVHGLYGRSLHEYVETLYFLGGKSICRESALRVLDYYYKDLAEFLAKNSEEVQLVLSIDTDLFGLPKKVYDIDELKAKLLNDVDGVVSGAIPLEEWEYADMLDYADSIEDIRGRAKNYALAWLLKKQSHSKVLVESR